jgi:Condensation domain
VSDHILVPFAGEDSGTAGLTWGQWDIWPAMRDEKASFSVGGWLPLPTGTTVHDVASDLAFLLHRYPALRTRLRFTDDGCPQQVVAQAGEVALAIVDAGAADPAQVAAELYQRYDSYVFDETREWPIRWAVVVSAGAVTHLVSVISHLVVDGPSVVTMLQDLAARDPVSGAAAGPVTALQPLALARWQASPAGRRKSDAALRHWDRLLRSVPARRFAGSSDPRQPPYWQLLYDSPASYLASVLLAARTGTSTSTVLLAAFAVVITRATGISPAVVQIVVNNRFRRDIAGTVSPLCEPIPCVIDATSGSFDEVVGRAWQQAIGAYRLSYYDPRQRAELITRIGRERGEEVDLDCILNDRRALNPQEAAGDPPTPAQVRAALERSELTWGWRKEIPGKNLIMHVNDVPDTVSYDLCVNTRYLSPADMESCLRGLEALLVEEALEVPNRAAPPGHKPCATVAAGPDEETT